MTSTATPARWIAERYRPLGGGQVAPAAGGDINVFDVFTQAQFTDLTRRRLQTMWETIPAIGDQIAPLFSTYDRTIEREVAEVAAFGVAQFRAPDATPGIYTPRERYTQEVVSLLLIDEMSRVTEDQHLRLTSPTPGIRYRAGVDLVNRAAALQIRNENRTEWMRWKAFLGEPFTIAYPQTGQQVTVTYNYADGHKPVAGVPWTDRANCTPIDDMRAWQQQIGDDLGYYGSRFHMNSVTWSLLQRSDQVRGYLTQTNRSLFLPNFEDVASLLLGAGSSDSQGNRISEAPQIIVSDAGYRDEGAGYDRGLASMTKYIPDYTVLVTAPYVFEGEPIADCADGVVAVQTGFNQLQWLPGPQSEVILDHYTHYYRQASARFVRLRRPEAFLTASVSSQS